MPDERVDPGQGSRPGAEMAQGDGPDRENPESPLAEMRRLPSRAKATSQTNPECVDKMWRLSPVSGFHNLIVESTPHDANILPSCENFTQFTNPVWPRKVCFISHDSVSQR